jgi:hypothetical protein
MLADFRDACCDGRATVKLSEFIFLSSLSSAMSSCRLSNQQRHSVILCSDMSIKISEILYVCTAM